MAQLLFVVGGVSRRIRSGHRRRPNRPRACRVESRRTIASIASGTAPPNMPECDACPSVLTVRRNVTLPAHRRSPRQRHIPPDGRTLAHASHSGMFGGAVPDAMLAMIKLLSTLHAEDGSVAVEGLTEREARPRHTSEEQLRDEAALLDGVSPIGSGPVLSRLWSKPSITVTGIDAPSVPNASNTLLRRCAVADQRADRARAGGADAFAALEAPPARQRPVRRPPRDRRRRPRRPVPRRHDRLGRRRGDSAR